MLSIITSSEDETQIKARVKATHERESARKNREKKRSKKSFMWKRSLSSSSSSKTSSDSRSESDNKYKSKSNKRKHKHSKKSKRSSSTRGRSPAAATTPLSVPSTSGLIQPKIEYRTLSASSDSEATLRSSAIKKPVDQPTKSIAPKPSAEKSKDGSVQRLDDCKPLLLQDHTSPREDDINTDECTEDIVNQIQESTEVEPKKKDAEISKNFVVKMVIPQYISKSGKSDRKEKPKDILLKLNSAQNKLVYVCKSLMVCDTKGCQFSVMHDCLRFYSDLVNPQDSTIEFKDILEVCKPKKCKWCGFIVTHKECFKKPNMSYFGLTTIIGSYTRSCTNCNWQATYSINTESNRICHWDHENSTSTGPKTCCCGCIEIYHKCTPESKKINQNNVTGKY